VARPLHEVIIIGAGIAGASLAYFLARRGLGDGVLILEREDQPGYHTTGRSAAVLAEYSPLALIRRLVAQSAPFLRQPPPGFSESPLLERAGLVVVADAEAWPALERLTPVMAAEGIHAVPLGFAALAERLPVLSEEHVAGGLSFPGDGHLDVHALHMGYLGHARRAGAVLRVRAEVTGLLVERGRCVGVQTEAGAERPMSLRARWVVNAAGAWVGELGRAAAAAPIPFSPLRRTVITFAAPEELERRVRGWPLVEHEHRGLYFKPESGGLLASPMDETPSPPCDARPAEEDVALCAERLSRIAPPLTPRSISRRWAGLRTFSPDRVPVVGEDPRVPGLFWLAGQGGMGIESSPALGAIAADLLLDGRTERFDARLLSAGRFR